MAIVGHWDSLEEAQKLVQSKLLAGVVQETWEEGQLLAVLPVMQIDSLSVIYNRQTTPGSAAFYDIHEQIGFTAEQTQTQKTVTLKRVAKATILDRFMMDTYKDPNDYRTIALSQLREGCMRTIENKLIYGDIDNDAAEFDGMGHLFEADAVSGDAFTSATNLQQFDEGGASQPLQLLHLRQLIDAVKPKPDFILMTRPMRNTLSAAAFEKGLTTNVPGGVITMAKNEFGTRIDYFDGFRIVISDYLSENEADHTGDESASTGLSSIFAVRLGQIMDGGLCLAIGGRTGGPEFFHMVEIPEMEDYDAAGIRLTAYCSLALGSSKAMARIHSIAHGTAVTS